MSARRIAANRQNARRSTGPRTAAGKAVVRMNALQHGLDAAPGVLLPGEGPAEREALALGYRKDLRPVTREEEDLVARMAETTWLQRRAEAAAYAAAEEAVAVHGPGANVLALECKAGGRGPFLRAEAWNCRLTGRLVRLVRQFDRARRAAPQATRLRGTKPLRDGGAGTCPGAPAWNKAIALQPQPKSQRQLQPARPTPRPEWSDGPGASPGPHGPARPERSEASLGSARGVGALAENKAIARAAERARRRNKAIAPIERAPAQPARRMLGRAIDAVVTGLLPM